MADERQSSIPANALAIIGLAGRFPGARDVEEFWSNISRGVSSIRTLSDDELTAAGESRAVFEQPGYVRRAALLEGIDLFDAPFFGFAAREAEIVDPQTRLFLECAWTALESAGYVPQAGDIVTGVFAGKGFPAYLWCNIASNPEIVRLVGELQTTIYNENDSLAPLAAYKLDLKGPSVSVQSFCSTSLLAVHLACQSLLGYECDLAIAGGAAVTIPHGRGYLCREGGILSPDGECRPFDAKANGSLIGSGVGAVLLKRLSEAIRDRDCIRAVIRGSATNNDGLQRVGYTAPSVNGQAAVVLEALSVAGVEAESIGYIETHGTGTPLGDAVELEALLKAFALHTDKARFCAIGSVKPNIGHLDRASGITNLIKTALALDRKKLPPCLNFEAANPDFDLDRSPFYVNTALRDWEPHGPWPRRAGTSSFGLGGTNVHVILEEAPPGGARSASRPYQHLVLSARTEGALEIATSNLVNALRADPELNLADAAFTLKVGRAAFNHRRMVVCSSARDGADALAVADPRRVFTAHQMRHDRPIAFMFPGVGDHYVGMGIGVYRSEPTFRNWVDECCALCAPYVGCDLRELIYPQGREGRQAVRGSSPARTGLFGTEGDAELATGPLRRTALAQPAVFVVEYALAQLLLEWGLKPKALIGYSLGEYTAACLAGVLGLEDALRVVAKRAEMIETVPAGSMLTVALPEAELTSRLGAELSLAACLAANTCVVSGPTDAIEELRAGLARQDIVCRLLPTAHAFHSAQMGCISADLEALFRRVRLNRVQIPYISNLTDTWITDRQATDPMYWVDHTCRPVRFSSGIATLLKDAKGLLFEVGPGQSLSAFARQHPDCGGPEPALVLPTLPSWFEEEDDPAFLLTSLGKAWLGGASVDWAAYYAHEARSRVALPTYPFERQRYWIEARAAGEDASAAVTAALADKRADIDSWFYLPAWRQTRLRPRPAAAPAGSAGDDWLVFADEAGLGARLAARLAARGGSVTRVQRGTGFAQEAPGVYRIDPQRREDYRELLRSLPRRPNHVVHAWAIDASNDHTVEGFTAAQQTGFYSLLYLIKALAGDADPLQIWAITSHSQSVTGAENLSAETATIGGICRVIPQENLNIDCHTIDIEPFCSDSDVAPWLIEQIAAEMSASNDDPAIAYRGRKRFVQVFEPTSLQRPSCESAFRARGVYLIIGGLGDVGMCIGRHMAHAARTRIVLSTRSSFPPRSEWERWTATHSATDRAGRRIEELLAWERAGAEVLVIQADAGNRLQMTSLLSEVVDRFGELHGVVYAAGSSGDDYLAPIQEVTEEQCEAHFRSKAHGLYVLESLIGGQQLDFCVVFSSISSILGGLGFAAYAAANRFLDLFTARQNDRHASWTCVNWDTWRTREDLHARLGATVARFDMSPGEANEVLERIILDRQLGHVVNSTGDLGFRIDQWVRPASLQRADGQSPAPSVLHPRPPLMCGYAPPTTDTEKLIAEVWQMLLGIEPVGINDDFFELGGHSLLATQIISRLRKTFRVHLPLAALLTAPTIAEFAALVELAIIEEIEQEGQTSGPQVS